jgi:hypothetical protein
MDNLYSVEEWLEYINQIPMLDMIPHAKIIGSVSFYEDLDAQGYDADEVMALYNALAKRFLELDMRVPDMMDGARINFRLLVADLVVPTDEDMV